MTSPNLASNIQKLQPGALVVLFRLDATVIGGGIYSFSPNVLEDGSGVTFGGVYYQPADVRATDFEVNGNGALPTPKFAVSNADGEVQQIVNQYGDLVGCTIQRVRTFEQYLDHNLATADPYAIFGPDTFRVERKVREEDEEIEWELSASIDQEGKMLPGRQVLRDFCPFRYRIWNADTETFEYAKATCPYAGDSYFKRDGSTTENPALDDCPRTVSACEQRFGAGNPLPFGGFPGVTRVRS